MVDEKKPAAAAEKPAKAVGRKTAGAAAAADEPAPKKATPKKATPKAAPKKAPAKKAAPKKAAPNKAAAKKAGATPITEPGAAPRRAAAAPKEGTPKRRTKRKASGKAARQGVKTIRIEQIRSPIGFNRSQREVLRGIGVRRIRHVVEREDTAAVRGMVAKIPHLVRIIEEQP